jgi:hypothetical protein
MLPEYCVYVTHELRCRCILDSRTHSRGSLSTPALQGLGEVACGCRWRRIKIEENNWDGEKRSLLLACEEVEKTKVWPLENWPQLRVVFAQCPCSNLDHSPEHAILPLLGQARQDHHNLFAHRARMRCRECATMCHQQRCKEGADRMCSDATRDSTRQQPGTQGQTDSYPYTAVILVAIFVVVLARGIM